MFNMAASLIELPDMNLGKTDNSLWQQLYESGANS
jgi:hypothetical protein